MVMKSEDYTEWLKKPSSKKKRGEETSNSVSDAKKQIKFLLKSLIQKMKMLMRCFPMFSAVFRCSQLFCDIFSWVITFMDNHTSVRCITNPCTRILLSSLYEVGNLWQDQAASVGNQIGPN